MDLINGLLQFDPAQRLTAAEALSHPWIKSCEHVVPSSSERMVISLVVFNLPGLSAFVN